MAYRVITIVFGFLLLMCLGALCQEAPENNLQKLVAKAKREGKKELTMIAPHPFCCEVPDDLEEALNHGKVVIAQPVKKQVTADHTGSVETAIKYRILETLHEEAPSKPGTDGELTSFGIDTLLPQASNEIIVFLNSGTVEIDGVRLTTKVRDDPGDLMQYPQQLLFLVTRYEGQVGLPVYGAYSFYAIQYEAPIRQLATGGRSPLIERLEALGGDPTPHLLLMRRPNQQQH